MAEAALSQEVEEPQAQQQAQQPAQQVEDRNWKQAKRLDSLIAEYSAVVAAHEASHQTALTRLVLFSGLMSTAFVFALANPVKVDRMCLIVFGAAASTYWFVALWRDIRFVRNRYRHGIKVERRIREKVCQTPKDQNASCICCPSYFSNVARPLGDAHGVGAAAGSCDHHEPKKCSQCWKNEQISQQGLIKWKQCWRVAFDHFHLTLPFAFGLAWLLLRVDEIHDQDRGGEHKHS
eukprot:jgi/Ulvmu1/1652/UM114_0021.1